MKSNPTFFKTVPTLRTWTRFNHLINQIKQYPHNTFAVACMNRVSMFLLISRYGKKKIVWSDFPEI